MCQRSAVLSFLISINCFHITGAILINVNATVGEKVTLHCPLARINDDQQIVWWRGKDKLVINNNIRLGLKDQLSYSNTTGNLTIRAAHLWDGAVYTCGPKFDSRIRHIINLTVFEKWLSTVSITTHRPTMPINITMDNGLNSNGTETLNFTRLIAGLIGGSLGKGILIIVVCLLCWFTRVKNLLPARIRQLVCRKTPRDSPIKEDNSTEIVNLVQEKNEAIKELQEQDV